jgi:hypothetical protein
MRAPALPLLAAALAAAAAAPSPIEHVVVVMLENRAFDHVSLAESGRALWSAADPAATPTPPWSAANPAATPTPPHLSTTPPSPERNEPQMLGHLALTNPNIDGITDPATRCNPLDPLDPSNTSVACINWNVVDEGPDDPCHGFTCVSQQITGYSTAVNATLPPLMNGFAANAISVKGSIDFVFSAYNATNLPVLSSLATEFAVFDRYHVSVPSCTNPNRAYLSESVSAVLSMAP